MSIDHTDATTSPLVVARWTRYGHDRAYVKDGDRDLGFRDLQTGTIHCDVSDDVDKVERATAEMFARLDETRQVTHYRARHRRPDSDDDSVPAAPPVGNDLVPDRDLAGHYPGRAARERAEQLRAAAPVRTFFARTVAAKTEERAWRIGADGEDEIAQRLARLADGWQVLHAVPVGERETDIDHVVIGPAGVFTVNTKNHPGAKVWVAGNNLMINGVEQPYIRNSRHEAARAARLLSAAAGLDVPVRGVIAVVGARGGFTIKDEPADVTVLRGRDLARYLGKATRLLDGPAIEQIYAAARHLSTWQPKTVARQDFPALD